MSPKDQPSKMETKDADAEAEAEQREQAEAQKKAREDIRADQDKQAKASQQAYVESQRVAQEQIDARTENEEAELERIRQTGQTHPSVGTGAKALPGSSTQPVPQGNADTANA